MSIFQIQNAIKKRLRVKMGSKTKVKTKRKKTEEKVSSKSSKKRKAKQKQNEKESRKRKLESSKKSSKSKSSKKMKKTPTDYHNILGLADKDRPGMSEEKKLRFVPGSKTGPNNHKILGKEFLKRGKKRQMKKNC